MTLNAGLLIEPDAVARIDAATEASGIGGFQLMTAAGLAVAATVLREYPGALRFVVFCGPGNNGGDGYIAAAAMALHGAVVEVVSTGALPASGDAGRASAGWALPVGDLADFHPRPGDVIIDAIFGAGLSRDLDPELADMIASVTAMDLPVIAVDMPSGICGKSGKIRGAAFRANLTVTFMARKPGQILLPGKDHCGRIEIAGIGVPDRIVQANSSAICENHPDLWLPSLAPRQLASHKFSHGHLMVFSGGPVATGAARLTAMAGLRSGAGLVTVAAPEAALAVNAAHLTAIMLKRLDDLSDLQMTLEDKRISAFVLGPGFGVGDKARRFVLHLAPTGKPLVLDADGITSFQGQPQDLFDAFAGSTRLVLTPHDGEFGRLFPAIAADRSLSKVEKAVRAAAQSNAIIVYKGSDTVIADPDGRATINTNGPPQLATAGSGDVLAGIIGGLLAGLSPPFEAAMAGVHIHGQAGQEARPGLTAETLLDHVRYPAAQHEI